MKTISILTTAFLLSVLPVIHTFAQEKGSGVVTKQDRELGSFESINVGCAINLILSEGAQQAVTVETDENLQDRIKTKVNNGELVLSCDNVRNPSKMNVYVTAPSIRSIDANGAATVKGLTPLNADKFSLNATGAAKVSLEVNSASFYNEASGASKETLVLKTGQMKSEISGASEVTLSGTGTEHKTEVSGAAKLKAMEFVTDITAAEVSGVANASVMARKQIKADLSGAGTMTYFDNNEIKKIGKAGEYILSFTGMDDVKSVIIDNDSETGKNDNEKTVTARTDDNGNVEVTVDDKKIVVVTDDSVRVKFGDNTLEINDDGDIKLKKDRKKSKFNGHWDGFEIGVNGYLTPDFDFNYPDEYSLLDQKYQKSINVNLNFFEQNINLIRNHVGLVTGLGLSWNNYRFEDNVRLTETDNKLALYKDQVEGVSYEKSKLVNTYLTLPLMLEAQTNRHAKVNSFHLSAGVVGGWRIGTHTKYVYDDGSRQKDKDRSDFYMNPFKLDAIAKIGWGVVNLYATYALTPMFQKNKGPELYPFSVGICLTDLTDL